jgi:hypothetical protein
MVFNDKYTAIIGDIVDSRKIRNRNEVQRKFKSVLDEINTKYAEDIASKFTITLGDEFQGLLKSKKNILKILWDIEMAMSPYEMRFGIGIGDINTDIDLDRSPTIDGPAYYRARKMVTELDNLKSQYAGRHSNMMICSDDNYTESDELINSVFSLCTALKSKWTQRQKEIIYAYFSNEENQYKAARALGIGQSSVSKALNHARFYTYKSAIDTVSLVLSGERGSADD